MLLRVEDFKVPVVAMAVGRTIFFHKAIDHTAI